MIAKRLAVGTNDGDFLDRNRAEGGTAHRLHILLIARADACCSRSVERSNRIPDARLGKRNSRAWRPCSPPTDLAVL